MAQPHPTLGQSYWERSYHPQLTPLASYLLRLMHSKQTNLCVSADVTTTAELLRVAEEVGDYICVLKTHADIVSDFGDRTIRGLNEIARRKKFLVFEDRKFGDIGNTVQQQYIGGPLGIVRWAPIVNAHIFPGPAIISALEQAAQQAILAYNTSVSTDISASPVPSVDGSFDDIPDPETTEDKDDPGNRSEEDIYGDEYENRYDARYARKQSVVSVSTTISMQSEALSPPPGHHHRPSLSRGSPGMTSQDGFFGLSSTTTAIAPVSPGTGVDFSDDLDNSPADCAAMLHDLGPPPYLRGLLLLAQMSSANNFFTPTYTEACLAQARLHREFVFGFIAQRSLNEDPADDAFITMTPGVQLAAGGDGKGQQYNTPASVVRDAGTDIIIVGRGILAATDRAVAAREYRRQGWEAYLDRVRSARRSSTGTVAATAEKK